MVTSFMGVQEGKKSFNWIKEVEVLIRLAMSLYSSGLTGSTHAIYFCRRTYEDLRLFDKQLHRCIYDRKFSQLPELRKNELKDENILVRKIPKYH